METESTAQAPAESEALALGLEPTAGHEQRLAAIHALRAAVASAQQAWLDVDERRRELEALAKAPDFLARAFAVGIGVQLGEIAAHLGMAPEQIDCEATAEGFTDFMDRLVQAASRLREAAKGREL